jgi:hypothetical protein
VPPCLLRRQYEDIRVNEDQSATWNRAQFLHRSRFHSDSDSDIANSSASASVIDAPNHPTKPAISKETIEAQLKRLALVYAAGDIDEATYQRQRAAWREQLEETGAPILPSAYNPRRAFEVLSELVNLLDGAHEAQQRSVLRHIFATLWLAPHCVVAITPTDLYAPMLAAVETLRGKDGDMGCPTGFGYRIQTHPKCSQSGTSRLLMRRVNRDEVCTPSFAAWYNASPRQREQSSPSPISQSH